MTIIGTDYTGCWKAAHTMVIPICIGVIVSLLISQYEYRKKLIIDVTLTSIVARNVHSTRSLLKLLSAKLILWSYLFSASWIIIEWSLKNDINTRASGGIVLIFVLIPLYSIQSSFAKWAKKHSVTGATMHDP